MASRECPNCHSERNWRDGLRETNHGSVQRLICRECGFRFSEKSYKESWTIENRQLCAIEKAKKLDTATELKTVAGEQTPEIKGALIQFPFYLKKEGMASKTVSCFSQIMQRMAKVADLNNPEDFKETLAKLSVCENTKVSYCTAYTVFLRCINRTWNPPKNLKYVQKMPEFLPTEGEIDQLVAGCGRKVSVLLQIIKETGFRIGEVLSLTWLAIDLEKRKISLTEPEKGGLPRVFNMSPILTGMLSRMSKENKKVFGKMTPSSAQNALRRSRVKLARKLQNPRIAEIHFHLIRHWFGTVQYHKKPDLEHTRKLLGHKSILNTQLYLHLDMMYFGERNDDFDCKIATTKEERIMYIEKGYDLVDKDSDGSWYFRKRK